MSLVQRVRSLERLLRLAERAVDELQRQRGVLVGQDGELLANIDALSTEMRHLTDFEANRPQQLAQRGQWILRLSRARDDQLERRVLLAERLLQLDAMLGERRASRLAVGRSLEALRGEWRQQQSRRALAQMPARQVANGVFQESAILNPGVPENDNDHTI